MSLKERFILEELESERLLKKGKFPKKEVDEQPASLENGEAQSEQQPHPTEASV